MSGRPWYAFYPDAYERDAGDLTYVQDSAYRRLLDHYYKTGAQLSLDKDSLYRACRALRREERTAIDHCLATFFDKLADGYHQVRADEEIKKSADVSAKRAQAANKRHSKPDAIAEQMHTQSTATATEEESSLRDDGAPAAPNVENVTFPDHTSKKRSKTAAKIEYPEWWPREKWADFQAMRRGARATLTPEAERLLILKLTAYRDDGQDIVAIINQSIENSYKGLFPVKQSNGARNGPARPSAHENFALGAYLAAEREPDAA